MADVPAFKEAEKGDDAGPCPECGGPRSWVYPNLKRMRPGELKPTDYAGMAHDIPWARCVKCGDMESRKQVDARRKAQGL